MAVATSIDDILGWINSAKDEKAEWLIIACDTFSYEDYPIVCKDEEEMVKQRDAHNGKNMQRIMEVYKIDDTVKERAEMPRGKYPKNLIRDDIKK